jgi:hypothetical protein
MLTDKQCKNASCPEGKARIRASDSGGLYIEVAGAGSKRWFWKYYFDGKEKRLSLGSYPEVSLKDARAARDDARKQHQSGADPVLARQVDRLSSRFDANASFEVTAREFHATKRVGWSDHYAKRWLERLGKDMRCVFSEFMRMLLLSRQGGPDCRASRDVADSAGAAATMAIRSTNCASDITPKPMGVIFPVKGWARYTAGTWVTFSVVAMPLSRRASGKPGIAPPSTLIATTRMPWRAWNASSVGAKAWQ